MPVRRECVKLMQQLDELQRMMAAANKYPAVYAGVELYANEFHTLRVIAQGEGISQAEVSGQMLRTKGATSAAVDKLVEKGLVLRRRVEGDQRRYVLTLTGLGSEVYRAGLSAQEEAARRMAAILALPGSDLEAAGRVLERLLEHYPETRGIGLLG